MSPLGPPRHGACPCGSGSPAASCCLPWEEAFQRLVSRVLAFADSAELREEAGAAADLFWCGEGASVDRRRADARLRFLEWFLQDSAAEGACGSHLARFADEAEDLPPLEGQLLLGWLLSPVRVYEVAESPSVRGVTLKDLLSGEERILAPFGMSRLPIRSDLLVCRLVPCGRVSRAGMGLLRLPAGMREELSAYLRMAYRVSRAPRHVSLEDFLDGNPHLYHQYFLGHGLGAGADSCQTVRDVRYAAGRAVYRVEDVARLLAALRRQPALEPEGALAGEEGYAWIDAAWGIPRAHILLSEAMLSLAAETQDDLGGVIGSLGQVLQGLARPLPVEPPVAAARPVRRSGAASECRGRAFLRRAIAAWPGLALPVLGGSSPRQAVLSPAGRRSVASLLAALERDLARQKRLGRAWVDVSGLWGSLGIADLAPAQAGPRRRNAESPRVSRGAGGRRTVTGPRRVRRDPHR